MKENTNLEVKDQIDDVGRFERVVTLQPNTFLNADCMEYLTKCPDNYFQLVIVDPPYGIGISSNPVRQAHAKKDWDASPPDKTYFDELMRVSENQIIWGGNYFNLPPTQNLLVWNKKQPEDFSLAMCEFAWNSIQKPAKIFNYSVLLEKDKIHPTQKPVELYKWILKLYAKAGDLILDTHVGSASSLIACKELGFDYVGFEIDKEYYEQASKRLERAFRKFELELK